MAQSLFKKLSTVLSLEKKSPNKSKEASKVLQLMDEDYSYSEALNKVLKSNKKTSKKKLEKELNLYI